MDSEADDVGESTRLTRRAVLRRGVAGTVGVAAVCTSPARVSADGGPLRLTVHVGGRVPDAHWEGYVEPAVRDFAGQAGVDLDVAHVTSIDRTVGWGDDYEQVMDRFTRWADGDDGVEHRQGHVNLLLYSQFPPFGSAYACHAREEYRADTAPIAIVNAEVGRLWSKTAYHNTTVTAVARPLLYGMLGVELSNGETVTGDVNHFGTVYEGVIDRASPLATWHTPAGDGCIKPYEFKGGREVTALCGYDGPRSACGYSTQLSECTRLATRAQLET